MYKNVRTLDAVPCYWHEIKLIFYLIAGKFFRDIEESNGKLWTTRSLSLFDTDDNVMIIRILDFNQKISDHVTNLFKSLFNYCKKIKNYRTEKLLIGKKIRKKVKKKWKKETQTSQVRNQTQKYKGEKVNSVRNITQFFYEKKKTCSENDVALRETLDFVRVNILGNLTVETAEPSG